MVAERIEADLGITKEQFEEYVNGKTGIALPADCPAYVRFWRIVETEPHRALKAVVLEIDLLFHGLKFYIRFGHGDGTVKLMSELAGEKELLGEWVKS